MPKSGLAHDVYFELVDDSPQARQQLIDSCYEKLAPIPGITFFAAGSRDEGLTRPVNDQVFDVGLHVYFVDRAAHDVYQDHPGHIAFIEDNMANWKSVRVFDGGFAR